MDNQHKVLRGKGATANPGSRFVAESREWLDDGWGADHRPDTVPIELRIDSAHSIITRNQSPDVPFEQSINPYKGCEHGCIYCFARPTHAYLDLSPGLDFESVIAYKPDAATLLRRELGKKSYRCVSTTLGANTDCYQPSERTLGITRQILEVLLECRHPITILTKSALIERDLDLLSEMARENLVQVMASVTTLDKNLARRMEPRAAAPARRLQTIERLSAAGVPIGILIAPVIPALNDHEIERIMQAGVEAGASASGYVLLRLPLEVSALFRAWLQQHYPLKYDHVMHALQAVRDGKDYESRFHRRMRGTGTRAEIIRQRFMLAQRKWKLHGQAGLDYSRFQPPVQACMRQLELL